jgi:hypothetical protein
MKITASPPPMVSQANRLLAGAALALALLAIPHIRHAQGIVFGISDHGYRCRGYHDRYDRFHCCR